MTAAARHAAILRRIHAACDRAGRDHEDVRLVAVSKQRPVEQTRELHDLGIRDFAENRVQEGVAKVPLLPSDVTWHLIGPLQTNKARNLPGVFAAIHSIERMKVAEAVEKECAAHGSVMTAFVQVNVAGEEQKSGCGPAEAEALVRGVAALPHLHLVGLMAMAPFAGDPEDARPTFRGLRQLRDRLQDATGIALPRLSMGMTGDFEVAIEEGATDVRIGTALYVD